MIELAESSSILTTAHKVTPGQAGLLEKPRAAGWGMLTGGVWSGSTTVRTTIVLSTGWGETFELGSLWGLGPLKALLALRALPQNWDGAGSPPPTKAALTHSVDLLRLIGNMGYDALPIPHVVPLTHGGIQFEWMAGSRELEIAIFATGAIEFVTAEAGEPQLEGQLTSLDQLRWLFVWLAAAA